jgi:hypothetical protein
LSGVPLPCDDPPHPVCRPVALDLAAEIRKVPLAVLLAKSSVPSRVKLLGPLQPNRN